MKNFIKSGLTVLISVLIVFTVVKAGTITPPSGTPSANFYTLSEIYNLVASNATTTEGSHDFTFSNALAATGRTLTEIYNKLATLISADKVKLDTTYLGVAGTLVPSGGDATTSEVLSGKYFFGGSQANWTLQTGIMANNGSFSLAASSSNQSVAAGYYSGGTLSGDSDLTVGNIKSGVNIFGVDGSVSASYDYSLQRYQVYDDYNCSGNNGGGTTTCAAGDAEYTGEEGTWTQTNTDASPPAGIASGKVYQDARTLLYWSDYFTTATSNSFTIDCTDAAINNGTCDYNSYATKGNAITLCDNLSLDADGGSQETDWRLPTQKELMQAYINGAANNLPNPAHYFWSSTEYYSITSFAWFVYLAYGHTGYDGKTYNYNVRCVRP